MLPKRHQTSSKSFSSQSLDPQEGKLSSVQLLSHVQLFVIPWTAACQASLCITNSWSLLKLMLIKSVVPFNHLILCCPLLLPPSVFPSIRVFSNESVLHINSVQLLSHVQLFVIPWTAACQASLSITNSWSLLRLMSIESVMPSNHLILCHPLLLLPSIFPSIRVFSNESYTRKPPLKKKKMMVVGNLLDW